MSGQEVSPVSLLKNRVLVAYAAVYVLSAALLVTAEKFPLGEILLVLTRR